MYHIYIYIYHSDDSDIFNHVHFCFEVHLQDGLKSAVFALHARTAGQLVTPEIGCFAIGKKIDSSIGKP